jgi:hypothetical protein
VGAGQHRKGDGGAKATSVRDSSHQSKNQRDERERESRGGVEGGRGKIKEWTRTVQVHRGSKESGHRRKARIVEQAVGESGDVWGQVVS